MRRLMISVLLLLAASVATAQNCPQGMLQITGPASYVSTQSAQALNLTQGFTIECCAKVDSALHGGAIIDKGLGLASAYGIFVDTSSNYFGLVRKNSAPIKLSSGRLTDLTAWHHIAYVFAPGDSIRLYIDSFEVASMSAKNITAIDSTTDNIRIGMSAMGVSFVGSIDELRLWNVPRTLLQIRQTLYSVVPGNDSTLALYYSFDDGIGFARVHDFSGHGRDGSLIGQNVAVVQSTSPIAQPSPGWQLAAKEASIIIPTKRCVAAFDTVIHIHNIGLRPDTIKAYAFGTSRTFTIVSSFPIPLRADSSYYVPIDLHFEPNSGGVFNDELLIIDSNECGGTLRIPVQATFDSVGLAFSPSVLSFGSVLSCDLNVPLIKTVEVTNVSLTDSVTLVAPKLPAGLALLTNLPRRIGPRDSIPVSFVLLAGPRGPVSVQAGITLDKCSRTAYLSVDAFRQQPEWSLPSKIDFGTVPADLNGITKDTIVVVRNTGNVSTTIQSVTISDTSITILDARKTVLRTPGDTLQLHLRVHPQSCGHVSAALHIKEPLCGIDTSTVVSIDVGEPLPLQMQGFDAGRICPTQSEKRIVIVANPNDKVVRLDSTVFSQNNVFFTPPLYPFVIPPHDSIPLEVLFQPALDGDYVDTAYLKMSPCGTGIAILRGSRGFAGLSFDASPLSFGRGCDTAPLRKTATLTNHSQRAMTIIDTVQAGSLKYHITPIALPFTLQPGASKTFEVGYTPTLGVVDTGSLTLRASEGCDAVTLSLRGSRERAKAKFASTILDFDTLCPGAAIAKSVTLKNLGLDSIDIQNVFVSGHGFTLDSAVNIVGDSINIRVRYTGYLIGSDTGTLLVNLDRCGTSLLLPLRGVTGPAPAIVLSDTTIDVGPTKVGATTVRCMTIANPSCSPLPIRIGTSALTPFNSDWDTATIPAGQTMKLCLTFEPVAYGESERTLVISSNSAPSRSVTLKGLGLAPDVRFAEHTVDFGYVLRSTTKTLAVHVTNVGNDTATLKASKKRIEYSAATPATLLPSISDSILVTFSPTQGTGLVLDTLVANWSGHYDTVYLRGQGTEEGMIPSATVLNFGDVHVTDSSVLPLYITATQDFPTLQSATLLPGSSPAFNDSAAVPYVIQNDHDTLTIAVKYRPTQERRDTGYLVISDGAKFDTILLSGRGVEAHVRVNPVLVDYGDVVLNTPLAVPSVQVTNTGSYRLFVTKLSIGPDFFPAIASDPDPILPDSSRAYVITFFPTRARHVVDSLVITTTSPDRIAPIALAGTGIYPSGTGPSFGYHIASTQTSSGERDTISVSIYGTRLTKIDADSLKLDITYDPSMILIHGIVADVPHRMTKINDSMIQCIIMTNSFSQGMLFSLDAEALLGPNQTSYIHIKRDEPHADIAESIDDGLYQVIDCGGSEHGVVFGNGYKVQSISPNPVSDALKMDYTLGFAGPVTIDLIDELGRIVKHLVSVEQQGAHRAVINVSSLPAGRYVYRIESLDFKASGSVLLVR